MRVRKAIGPAARLDDRPMLAGRESLYLGGILLITLLAYLRCLANGFVFDDREIIFENPYIGRWSFLWRSLVNDSEWFRDPLHLPVSSRYRPLSNVWFGLHYHLFGSNPIGWHATTVALHLAAVWMVFKIGARLTGDRRTALLGALLFGVLAAHAQAVAWASSIGLLLSATLELGAFYLFIVRERAALRCITIAVALYAGALLSHESAVVFSALIGAYVFLLESWDARAVAAKSNAAWRRLRRALIGAAPFVIFALAYFVVRRLVLGFFINGPSSAINRASTVQVLMTIPRVILTYLVVMAIPWMAGSAHRQLIMTTPASPNFVTSPFLPDFYLPVALLAVLASVFFLALGAHPRRRLYLFCAAWMGIAMAPMMNLAPILRDLQVQDAYLYLASAMWCVMVADWVVGLAEAIARARRKLVWGGVAVATAAYALALGNVQRLWRDDITLFAGCVEVFPEAETCHRALGGALARAHDPAAAEPELAKAASLEPGDYLALRWLAQAHAALGRPGQAVAEMERAIELTPHPSPGDYAFLAELYDRNGEPRQSEAVLRFAQSLPDGPQAAGIARAKIRLSHGDPAGAEETLHALTNRYSDDHRVWSELALALEALKRDQDALSAFERAIELTPLDPEPRFFAARLLHSMGRDREALAQCRAALDAEPDDKNARELRTEISRHLPSR